jgi:hypothetical protein
MVIGPAMQSFQAQLHTSGSPKCYFQGKRSQSTVPLQIQGTEFQQKVYHLILEVPLGAATSYTELAAKLKMPRAARSIGAAIVAWSKGYPDGNNMPPRLLAHLAGKIVKTVKVPVSIDFEAGYSNKPTVVVENLKPTVAAGISGINIEIQKS